MWVNIHFFIKPYNINWTIRDNCLYCSNLGINERLNNISNVSRNHKNVYVQYTAGLLLPPIWGQKGLITWEVSLFCRLWTLVSELHWKKKKRRSLGSLFHFTSLLLQRIKGCFHFIERMKAIFTKQSSTEHTRQRGKIGFLIEERFISLIFRAQSVFWEHMSTQPKSPAQTEFTLSSLLFVCNEAWRRQTCETTPCVSDTTEVFWHSGPFIMLLKPLPPPKYGMASKDNTTLSNVCE